MKICVCIYCEVPIRFNNNSIIWNLNSKDIPQFLFLSFDVFILLLFISLLIVHRSMLYEHIFLFVFFSRRFVKHWTTCCFFHRGKNCKQSAALNVGYIYAIKTTTQFIRTFAKRFLFHKWIPIQPFNVWQFEFFIKLKIHFGICCAHWSNKDCPNPSELWTMTDHGK